MPGTPIRAVADIEGGLSESAARSADSSAPSTLAAISYWNGTVGGAFLPRVSNSSLGVFARTNEENE